ncbi:MAG TPA: hypothetical protein VEO54_19620 [Thermoanaerobaculia bacterium]|nr:hypothetical protein [Thermoanaerobaculia bacterium]
MARKPNAVRKSPKVVLQRATIEEMIEAYGFTPRELRRAKAIVAEAERALGRQSPAAKNDVAGKVVRWRKRPAGD